MSSDEHWFPTPANCPNPEKLEGINKRFYEEIAKLKKPGKKDPEERKNFLAQFPWANSVLYSSQKKQVEDLSLRYHLFLHDIA